MRQNNIQVLWADLIIEELMRLEVSFFGYAPGSRNSPFAVALSTKKAAQVSVHFDERALAFMALGAAKASQKPAVLIATSGTAGINFLPAIVEAYESGIPLFVITGDRPYELLEVGEGQTIDQLKMYQNFTRGFFDLPVPSKEMGPEFVLSTVDALHYKALRMRGPVHLNAHFREPMFTNALDQKKPVGDEDHKEMQGLKAYLKNIETWEKSKKPYATYSAGGFQGNIQRGFQLEGRKEATAESLIEDLASASSGVIIVGRLDTEEEKRAALALIEKWQWPAFVDVTSGLFFKDCPYIINHYDWILTKVDLDDPDAKTPSSLDFDTAVHLGHEFVSKRLRLFLKKQRPKLIYVSPGMSRYDPGHVIQKRLEMPIEAFCASDVATQPSDKLIELRQEDERVEALMEEKSFPIQSLVKHLPEEHLIFLASSLSIRDFAWFANRKGLKKGPSCILANRGASGIDGTVASFIGASLGSDKPATLFIGDLAFLYDLTSLSLMKEAMRPLVIVVFNNEGGGIFHLLPIAKFEKVMPFVEAKHSWPLKPFIEGFGIGYAKVDMTKDDGEPHSQEELLEQAYLEALKAKGPTILEVVLESGPHADKIRAFTQKVKLAHQEVSLVN